MPYLVGDLIKEIETGGPTTSFPKSFNGPPKSEKEKEAARYDEMRAKRAREDAMRNAAEQPREDWVRNKWAQFYDVNHTGQEKPNFSMMTYAQFREYTLDAQLQGRLRRDTTSTHTDSRDFPVSKPENGLLASVPVLNGSGPRKVVALAAEPQFAINPEPRPRKKPRVKAHIPKEEYLKERRILRGPMVPVLYTVSATVGHG